MKNFTSIHDIKDPELLVQEALKLKESPASYTHLGKGKTLVLLFFNPSLRTRLSTQKAAMDLGMNVICMNLNEGWNLEFEDGVTMNTDKAEHIKEAAVVISQYADIIGIRTFPSLTDKEKDYKDFILNNFIRHSEVPIISLESAIRHPLQSLADRITIQELKQVEKPKVVLTWAPHPKALPQAVSNSFLEWMKPTDVQLLITHPKGYELAPEFTKDIPVEYDQEKAFEGADFIYVKNWSALEPYGKMLPQQEDWMVTAEKIRKTNNAKVMHCLPVRRNVVIEGALLDSDPSVVIHQANNRTFAAKAVLKKIL